MPLALPNRVVREIEKDKWIARRAEHRALAFRLLDFDDPVCLEHEAMAREIDPLLRIARGRNRAYGDGAELGIRPGFYHWVRLNPGAPLTISPITAADGVSFAEPSSGWLEDMRGRDLRNPRVVADLLEQEMRAEAARERERENDRAEIDAEVVDRWKAATRAQVSMSDVPWSQNNSAAARRARRAAKA